MIPQDDGIFENIDINAYHGDKSSLSVSGAKLLLPPSCPALFKWVRDNGQPARQEFDFGTVAHQLLLGKGAEIVEIDAPDYRSKPRGRRATRRANTVRFRSCRTSWRPRTRW